MRLNPHRHCKHAFKPNRQIKSINYIISPAELIIFKVMKSSQDIAGQRRLWSIKREYLSLASYESVRKNSVKLNQLYNQLCQISIWNFQALRSNEPLIAELKAGSFKEARHSQYPSMGLLARFVVDFTIVINQVAHYQIGCLLRLQEENRPDFQVFLEFTKRLKKLDACLGQMEGSRSKLEFIFKQVKLDFTAYRKSEAEPIKYYDRNYVLSYNERLLRNIDEAAGQIRDIEDRKESMQSQISEFESLFSKLKCKLVKNKYAVLKKANFFVQNGKSYMAELLQLLRQCVVNHKEIYSKAIQEKADESGQLKELLSKSTQLSFEHPLDQNKRWEKAIRATLGVYWQENEGIEKILHRFQDYLCAVCKSFQERKGRLRQVASRLSQFYEVKESPYEQLHIFVEMQGQLHGRMLKMGDKINGMILLLRQQKRECMKLGQIVLSVLKIKSRRRESLLDPQESINKKDISQLVNEIASSSPKQQISSFYQLCINTQLELLRSVRETIKSKKRPIVDSMEISHSIPHFTVQRKRPLKEQVWLWRQPKQQMKIHLQAYQLYFDDVRKFIEEMGQRFASKDSVELEQYRCVLLPLKREATLTILSQGISINAKQSHLQMGWKDITNLSEHNSFFDKMMVVETSQGKIQLAKFKQDVPSIIKSMRQIQEKSLMANQTKVQSKRQVRLTQDQIQQIWQRKEKIMSEVPSADDFKLIIEEEFEGQRIDQIYELIYSDKPFSFYGREEPCFFSYTGKKSGNFNWVAQKYDKPGPEFYSLEEGVTFKNCPLFSTRKISYNHPLKPRSIPFMPRQSRNVDERRMYWVSHEELVYLIKSLTFEVPLSDNFEVHIVHRIAKTPNAVKIQILSKIVFVKETSFKNIIASNTDPLIDQNMVAFMAQIRKLLRLRRQAASGAKIQPEPQPEPIANTASAGESEVGKLKVYNRVLLLGVVLLLLLNLWRVWWS